MGKRHFKGGNNADAKKRRKEAAEKWRSVRGDENTRSSWVLENARLQAFYKAQKFLDGEEDFAAFMKHLQTPLPACFRIWSDYAFADELRNQMLQFAGKTMAVDGAEIRAAEQLHWYPGGYAYKLGTDRRSIRKLEELNDLHKWMMQHTDNGNITRQEAVSMVPPLALNVEPHHRCLDMCAAPGSKTSQLLEIVNRSLAYPESQQGTVVANDADTDRAYMLVHQCKRINSPLLVVSTHKGQQFPTITETEGVAKAVPFFDRVLCDVPCSGDGTLRKNPAIWDKWSTSGGVTLHPLQLMIAQRGLQLLNEGGLMVYSTCSMSPYGTVQCGYVNSSCAVLLLFFFRVCMQRTRLWWRSCCAVRREVWSWSMPGSSCLCSAAARALPPGWCWTTRTRSNGRSGRRRRRRR
jgi:16S rRNA C967 or C1407 C5-methylase (RsmB/RsmF family)